MAYLNLIIHALEKFYQYDACLLESVRPAQHEQTISFRLAKYLSEELEGHKSNMVIDCEYQRMVNEAGESDLKRIGKKRIRPDIIYHQRGDCNNNGFIIEMKRGEPYNKKVENGKLVKYSDIQKVKDEVTALGYQEGFCVYHINKDSVMIFEVRKDKDISHTFNVDRTGKFLCLKEDKSKKSSNDNDVK